METIIGIIASACTGVSLIPQLVKVLKEKKAGDISLGMMAVLFAGLTLWVWYGILINDLIIIIANSFSFIINAVLGICTLKYRNKTTRVSARSNP
jgi:MtN3 and saliva related transmembrane protein